jgi:hypothetical protein
MRRPVDATGPAFTQTEQLALRALRRRYWEGCDLFSSREQTYLLFLRWLYRRGSFLPSPGRESHGVIPEEAAA